MTKKTGWIEEVTFGTSPLAAPATDHVFHWGKMDHGWQHPWHEKPQTLIWNAANVIAAESVRGTNKLEVKMKHVPVHAWPWLYGGFNTITSGGAGIYVLEPSNTVALRSRTGYFEHDSDIVEAQGLVTKDLNFYLELDKPSVMEEDMVGTSCKTGTILTHDPTPNWPASIASTDTVGWAKITTLEGNDVALQASKIHISIHNFIQYHKGMMNAAGTGANYDILSARRYAMGIVVNMTCPFKGLANDWWALYKAATEDKKFELSLTWGTNYWQFVFYNMRYESCKVDIPRPEDEGSDSIYNISGATWWDAASPTNLPKITVKDGSVYA
jgi:hypothetical protein